MTKTGQDRAPLNGVARAKMRNRSKGRAALVARGPRCLSATRTAEVKADSAEVRSRRRVQTSSPRLSALYPIPVSSPGCPSHGDGFNCSVVKEIAAVLTTRALTLDQKENNGPRDHEPLFAAELTSNATLRRGRTGLPVAATRIQPAACSVAQRGGAACRYFGDIARGMPTPRFARCRENRGWPAACSIWRQRRAASPGAEPAAVGRIHPLRHVCPPAPCGKPMDLARSALRPGSGHLGLGLQHVGGQAWLLYFSRDDGFLAFAAENSSLKPRAFFRDRLTA